jgi:large subunit ribosomal protein L11
MSSSRVIKGVARLRVNAGKAAPSPAIGQALGPLGVNMMEFCKEFNDKTKDMNEVPIPVKLTAFDNRTFSFETTTPPTSFFLKRCADGGDSVDMKQVYEIAKIKLTDKNNAHISERAMCSMICGTAKSMQLEVTSGEE